MTEKPNVLVQELMDQVAREYDREYGNDPKLDRLREIARRYAREQRLDPEKIVVGGDPFVVQDRTGKVGVFFWVDGAKFMPTWTMFIADARLALDLVEPPAPTAEETRGQAVTRAFKFG